GRGYGVAVGADASAEAVREHHEDLPEGADGLEHPRARVHAHLRGSLLGKGASGHDGDLSDPRRSDDARQDARAARQVERVHPEATPGGAADTHAASRGRNEGEVRGTGAGRALITMPVKVFEAPTLFRR